MATYALSEKAIVLKPEDDVTVARAARAGRRRDGPPLRAGHRLRHPAYRRRRPRPQPQPNCGGSDMEEDMDVNCGVILEGTPPPAVGRQIFEEIITVASGKRTKSELSGVGEEEFAPC